MNRSHKFYHYKTNTSHNLRLLLIGILMPLILVACNLATQPEEPTNPIESITSEAVLAINDLPTPLVIGVPDTIEQAEPTPTDVAIPTPTDIPIEDLPQESNPIEYIPDPIEENLRRIYLWGQTQGARPRVFSKVGDSITVSFNFLQAIGEGNYNLAGYAYLQEVIDYYGIENARQGNSFRNASLAAAEGWAAWAVLDPDFAPPQCNPGELPIECEYRIVQPSVAIIMFGTNDVGYRTPDQYRSDLTRILEISYERGIIPLFSTIPNRPDVAPKVVIFNEIVREIGATYRLPIIDYGAATYGLPNYGLSRDNVHPSSPPAGYNGSAVFTPANLRYGYVVRNLTTLQALDTVWQYLRTLP